MEVFYNVFNNKYIIGFFWIFVGIVLIYFAKKYPSKAEDAWFAGNLKGFIGGIGLIIVGLLTLIGKLFNLH